MSPPAPSAALIVLGNYTPAAWQGILSNPDSAPATHEKIAEELGATLFGFWFALDEYDFVAVFEGADPLRYLALRHRLFATGEFAALEAEVLFRPDELLGTLRVAGAPPVRTT